MTLRSLQALFHRLDDYFPASRDRQRRGPRRIGYYDLFYNESDAWLSNHRGFDRFERLCMDEAYIYSRTDQLVCKQCHQLHTSDIFSQAQINQPRHTCRSSGRLLRLTTVDTLCWWEIKAWMIERPTLGPRKGMQTYVNPTGPLCDWNQMEVVQVWKLRFRSPVGWEDQLTHLLETETVYSCPHRKTHHRELGQAIIRYKEGKWGRIRTIHCSQYPVCNMKVEYDLGPKSSWKSRSRVAPTISIMARRLLESGWDNPLWLAQTE